MTAADPTLLDALLTFGVVCAAVAVLGAAAWLVLTFAPARLIVGLCRLLRIPVVDLDHVEPAHRQPLVDQAARFGLVTDPRQEPPCTP